MNLQTFLINIALFLDQTILPFIIAFAGLFFLWNAVRYFIIGGSNPGDQEKARTLAMWGILAFVLVFSVWGIVRLMVNSLDLGELERPIVPDYMQQQSR